MTWTSVAPQSSTRTTITSTAVLGGELYAVTSGLDGALLKWNGTNAWTVVAASITGGDLCRSLIVYSGSLYAICPTSAGPTTAGRLYEFNGSAWSSSNTPSATVVQATTLSGRAFVVGSTGVLSEYVGSTTYTTRSAATAGVAPVAAIGFGSDIWAAFIDDTVMYVGTSGSSGTAWTTAATLSGESVTSMGVHDAELYIGTSTGNLYKWNGSSFALQASSTNSVPITALLSFNSKLYAGLSQI